MNMYCLRQKVTITANYTGYRITHYQMNEVQPHNVAKLHQNYIHINATLQLGEKMQLCAITIFFSIILKLVLIWCLDRRTVPINKSPQA